MIHYYYGNGKGKTSAAAGACLRAAGSGLRCAVIQFLKNGTSSEITLLRRCGIDIFACDFQGIRFFSRMSAAEQERVILAHNENLRSVIAGAYQMLVLDELGDAVEKKAVDPELVHTVLTLPDTEIIVTGHRKLEQFMQCADYITEFRCIAHPFQNGQPARKGIEF
jgi:cob(I)alamin adenosyltransferase